MNFYIIVTTIAIIFLIIILTIMGIFLSNKTSNQIFPPVKNNCPDYWTTTTIDSSNNVCKINNKNSGKILNADGTYNTEALAKVPGINTTRDEINFKDPGFSSTYKSTQICALHKWANANEIAWDGVSNYNGC